MKGSLAVLLGLAVLRFLIKGSQETPLQTVAFIIELAVFMALSLLDKARVKYKQPKLWLDQKAFMLDEQDRMNKNRSLDHWTLVLLSVAVACVGLYAAPLLSAGWRIVCLAVTGVMVIIFQAYDLRKISQFKRSRNELLEQLDYLQRE
jgi:Flp pilus assembly protein TadB